MCFDWLPSHLEGLEAKGDRQIVKTHFFFSRSETTSTVPATNSPQGTLGEGRISLGSDVVAFRSFVFILEIFPC